MKAPLLAAAFFSLSAVASAAGVPGLKHRRDMEPGGHEPQGLASNLSLTAGNIGRLLRYITPGKKDAAVPSGPELDEAMKLLDAESAAAAELIAVGDKLLAEGIARVRRDHGPSKNFMFITNPVIRYPKPSDAQRRLTVATVRANVAGQMGSLINLKLYGPALEATRTEEWLAGARRLREEHEAKAP